MLSRLVHFALAQRVLVLALAALLVVLGVRAGRDVPLDVFPEFAPPMVEIQTEAPGLSTEEVESLVTVPIETAVNGVPGLMTLRSKSVLGLSSVQILFERGSDVIRARQMVGERIAQVQPRLPLAARQPVLMPPLSSTSRAMKVGLSSTKLDQMQLSELVRWTIRPRLMAVPGVANVAVWGQRDRQLQVLVDPDRLRASGVTLAEVRAAAGDAVLVGGGGFVDTPNQRLAVQQAGTVQTAGGRSAGSDRRRRARGRRLQRADRQRHHRRRPRHHADRREAAYRQHPGADPRGRGRVRRAEAGLEGREGRYDHLPAGDLHRTLDR
jgi:Cu/Ag efflux pump CusA